MSVREQLARARELLVARSAALNATPPTSPRPVVGAPPRGSIMTLAEHGRDRADRHDVARLVDRLADRRARATRVRACRGEPSHSTTRSARAMRWTK